MSIIAQLDNGESFTPWMELAEKIAVRRLKVRSLIRKGYTKAHIARITKVSKMTVSRDINWFSENNINFMSNFNPQLRISESVMLYKEIEDEAMKSMYECGDTEKERRSKVSLMKAAIEARRIGDNLLSEIGAFKVKMEDNGPDISKMNEEELDKFMLDSSEKLKALEKEITEIEKEDEDFPTKDPSWRMGLIGK